MIGSGALRLSERSNGVHSRLIGSASPHLSVFTLLIGSVVMRAPLKQISSRVMGLVRKGELAVL